MSLVMMTVKSLCGRFLRMVVLEVVHDDDEKS
jgi:hypothetical protein